MLDKELGISFRNYPEYDFRNVELIASKGIIEDENEYTTILEYVESNYDVESKYEQIKYLNKLLADFHRRNAEL